MKCIVCGAASWIFLFPVRDRMYRLPGKFGEYRCSKCGLVRLDPWPKNLKRYYPSDNYYSYMQDVKKSFFSRLRTYLIRHPLPGGILQVPAMPGRRKGRILDIGCGSGDTLAILKELGWDVYGLDIDANAIAAAKSRGLSHVSLGSYTQLRNYPDSYFDVVRMYHVIEHLDNPPLCLALVKKKLKKGGELIIGTPNAGSLAAKLFRSQWYNLDAPRHLYVFTPGSLKKLVRTYDYKGITVLFCSAGGWVGSLQYMLSQRLSKPVNFIHRQWLVLLFYPFEWILDRLGLGDVFILKAMK